MARTISKTSKTPVQILDADLISKATPRKWTVANAESGAKGVKTPAQAAAYLAGAKVAYDAASETRMVAAAYATKVGIAQGMQQKDIAEAMGFAQSTVTLYKRLSMAVDKGITPDTDAATWSMLARGSMGTDAEVGKALGKKENTSADIAKVVAKQHAAKVAKTSGDKGKTGTTKKATPAGSKPSQPEFPRGHSAQITWIEQLAARLSVGKALSPRERERLELVWDGIGVLLHGESDQAANAS